MMQYNIKIVHEPVKTKDKNIYLRSVLKLDQEYSKYP